MKPISILIVFLCLSSTQIVAQWSNRYPKVDGFRHHVYLEGYELPILTSGPMDPAPSPVSNEIVFAAKGWLWIMNLETSEAQRVTSSSGIDSRPEWSPDGKQIVFIRDDSRDTQIISLDVASKRETLVVNEPALDLDPIYSPDGKFIHYSSAIDGSINLWKMNVETLEKMAITKGNGLRRRPIVLPSGDKLVFLNKEGSYNSLELLDLIDGSSTSLVEDRIASQADMTLSPDGSYLAYTWPFDGGYEMRLLSLVTPNTSLLLTRSEGMPLAPAFDSKGEWIYFAEANDEETTLLKRISANGGSPEEITIKTYNWGSETGSLKINSKVDGVEENVRMNVLNANGHPLVPEFGTIHSEGQSGRVFFYSNGAIEINGVAGEVTLSAVRGFETAEVTQKAIIEAGVIKEVVINLQTIWDANANGWYSGDNHFHLNYGGTYRLDPEDIIPEINGEGLDVAIPLLANLHNRFLQQELWGWKREKAPIISFGQEVRSHFLGHVELINTNDLFWPWIWGPYYQLYNQDDRFNAIALRHARSQGGVGGYVHPVGTEKPFDEGGAAAVPINFVADAVLGEVDIIEVACLWSNEVGTASLWHKILNLGIPLAASAGSDVMNNLNRTMPVGSTRVYVKPEGQLNLDNYLDALKKGRSFVSTGPLMEFQIEGNDPGSAINTGTKKAKWNLNVHSALPYEKVEIFVNGKVVWSKPGNDLAGSKSYKGSVSLPTGGWITVRVHGGEVAWPSMNKYIFAETSPVWIGSVGSTEPVVAKQSASDLLKVLDVSEERLKQGYGDTPIPNLLGHFEQAREKLKARMKD